MKALKYFKIGFKLWLIALLSGIVLIIPGILIEGFDILHPTGTGAVLLVLFIFVAFIINGWLLIKFKNFLYK